MPPTPDELVSRTAPRHELLRQIRAHAGTPRQWIRTVNPKKVKDPDSGHPDHFYAVQDPDHHASSTEQRAVRMFDLNGLLTATPQPDGTEALALSPFGEETLDAWNQ